ncbi:thioredoxin [Mesorhizobium sp. L-8-10]|uniref:thioredoxin n=1 Tax=unclassified Mesorhizobium TaxID=325217 RepID=UPI001926D054|nr:MULTISPECIES: thioredoxin [unclassified Mesorhizobium]BCH22104.1 thioredoxin [Mesorhizobium sp. L-8-3]BCH29917.1 thioredoxin [Mesorhizobium sp. L-8-10]
MDDKNNPYAGNGGGYATNVQFGTPQGNGPAGADKTLIKDTTTANFSADVIQESRKQPVLVDFWAPWCGPCKQLTPVLEKAVQAAGGRVKLVKMNIDDHPAIPGQLGIQSIPAVIAFKNGQPVDGFMGAVPESQVKEFIQRVGGKGEAETGIAEALAAATEARAAGDARTAADIYSALVEQFPDNVEALAGLAELVLESGDAQGALSLLDGAPAEKKDAPALAAIRTRIALAEQAASLGNAAEFESRLAANPKDHQARFDLAMIQNAEGKRMEAADNLLAIVKADRSWQDDGARAQLVKFFEAWGPTDEATLAARRKLSSVLFS